MKLSSSKSRRMIRAFMAEDRIQVNQIYADLCRHIRVRRSDRRDTRVRRTYRNILQERFINTPQRVNSKRRRI